MTTMSSTREVSSAVRCRARMFSARPSSSLTVNGLPEGAASESKNSLNSLMASARNQLAQREVALRSRPSRLH